MGRSDHLAGKRGGTLVERASPCQRRVRAMNVTAGCVFAEIRRVHNHKLPDFQDAAYG